MLIRFLDIVISLLALVLLSPVFLILMLIILIVDGSPVFFVQNRTGKNFSEFRMYKFRTMIRDSEDEKGITTGSSDVRITRLGQKLRKYKFDEWPQFFNVLSGSMSVIGSRPQIPYYTRKFEDLYSQILVKKPGILSPSAIQYSNEEEILAAIDDPVSYYENHLIPVKCRMDIEMVRKFGVKLYFNALFSFVKKIL